MTIERAGFIGTGNMGGPIAMRLLDAGIPLTICDPNPAATAPLRERGARVAATPREVADNAEIVFACLFSSEISRKVALGPDGVVKGKAVKIYLEMSTVGSATIEAISEGLRSAGIDFLDCPVSKEPGTRSPVQAGEQVSLVATKGKGGNALSTMVAGPSSALDRVRPMLEHIARNIMYVGEKPGLAQMAKLINNYISLAARVASFEGVVMGEKAGIDPKVLVDIINVSSGRNSTTTDKFPAAILPRTFKWAGPLTLTTKDVELFLDEAKKIDMPLWLGTNVLKMYTDAIDQGYGERDSLRVIEFVEERAGVTAPIPHKA